MNKHLHIISFTVPYPPDYGGVFDLFYKIKALHEAGVRIHLHCFTSGVQQEELEQYCDDVFYYTRKTGIGGVSMKLPYIANSRKSDELINRLKQDEYPVFVEGIHSSAFLLDYEQNGRKLALRLHNIEHIYYAHLYSASNSMFKRLYYKTEAKLLARYEAEVLHRVDTVFTVSEADADYCRNTYHISNTKHLPVFTGFHFSAQPGTGCFCLYHGNLQVAENESAVKWLLTEVFSQINIPLIVAGRRPSRELVKTINEYSNVTLIADPDDEILADLLHKSQCSVLPSHNATGVKLKIIHALYAGRHCIVNSAAVAGMGVEDLCVVAEDSSEFRRKVWELYLQPITSRQLQHRRDVLDQLFNNEKLALELIQWLS